MMERIPRQGDKKVYQPQLTSQRVKDLHILKTETGIPMTVLADRAIREYVMNYKTGQVEWIEEEPWEEHQSQIESLNEIDQGDPDNNNPKA